MSKSKGFFLGTTSRSNLAGVHHDGVILCATAIRLATVDFGISEGLRTKETQRHYIDIGVSWTMDSRHLTGHAWDVFAVVDGKANYAWPLMHKIHEAFLQASEITKIPFEWGGHWKGKKADGPHYQLPRRLYPA